MTAKRLASTIVSVETRERLMRNQIRDLIIWTSWTCIAASVGDAGVIHRQSLQNHESVLRQSIGRFDARERERSYFAGGLIQEA
jgi:hypothetical protein